MSMFEKASRLKLRFPSTRGLLTVEDLWGLPLTGKTVPSLDAIAVDLHSSLRSETQISFVDNAVKSKDEQLNQLRFDIVKHIIDVRINEDAAKTQKAQLDQQRAALTEALEMKRQERLQGKSVEELEAELALLNAKAAS